MCQEIGKCNAFQACDFVARLTKNEEKRGNREENREKEYDTNKN